jgi:hypothetical protein
MFSKATPLPGKALAWLNEDHALLAIGPVSIRVQTGGLNDRPLCESNCRSNGDITDAANDSYWPTSA